jgi:predicted amidophosphoribosyltransferase
VRLEDLKGAYAGLQFERAVERLADPEIESLPDLSFIQKSKFHGASGKALASVLYTAGKRLVFAGQRTEALRAIELARDFGCDAPGLPDRLHLLRHMPDPATIEWRVNLQEMQRQFGTICTRQPCACDDHYAMARCLGIFGGDHSEDLIADGTGIAVIGLYHSWTKTTVWSKLVNRIKHGHESDLVPFVARIAAGFMLNERRRWQDSEVLVPVPPSTEKYGKRGFAPTDLLAKEISAMLAIPLRAALVRKPGVATREASYSELARQFSVDVRKLRDLKNIRIVLIEDVVTTGKTVSICARKLAEAGPEAVDVLALARATRL